MTEKEKSIKIEQASEAFQKKVRVQKAQTNFTYRQVLARTTARQFGVNGKFLENLLVQPYFSGDH